MRLPGFLSGFAYRNYRLLWTGAFLSSLGTWTQDVALAWLIHTQLRKPFYLGLRAFAAEAPLLAFMLIGGAVADRVDRRRILLTSQTLQMTFAMALLVLWALDRLGIGAILLLNYLGFIIASILFMAALIYLSGSRKPLEISFFSVATTIAVYLLFQKFFEVQLPDGTLF